MKVFQVDCITYFHSKTQQLDKSWSRI